MECRKWHLTTKPIIAQTGTGTLLDFDGAEGQSILYVFSPGEPSFSNPDEVADGRFDTCEITGDWAISYMPTMDNKWGDFRLPASAETIGVEAREIASSRLHAGDTITSIYGYAPYMEVAVLDADADINSVIDNIASAPWQPYVYSWQYGVRDNPGSQGYHGLKSKVDDRFLILDHEGHMAFRTEAHVSQAGDYTIVVEGVKPALLSIDGKTCADTLASLSAGWHDLLILYPNTRRDPASPAQALFIEPVKINCGKGSMALGDWSQYGALKYYSGGIVYKKTIDIDLTDAASVTIDLGEVDATCEISVNGYEPQISVCPPFTFDITDFVRDGENLIEVTIYSSLSNHYQTIPSRYRGTPHSGLFDPVKLTINKRGGG